MKTAIAFCCAGGFRMSSPALAKRSGDCSGASHENRVRFISSGSTHRSRDDWWCRPRDRHPRDLDGCGAEAKVLPRTNKRNQRMRRLQKLPKRRVNGRTRSKAILKPWLREENSFNNTASSVMEKKREAQAKPRVHCGKRCRLQHPARSSG